MLKNYQNARWFEKLLFSPILVKKNATHKIAYLGLMTALLIVCNAFLEIKFIDVQFSVTLFISMIAGVVLGAGSGFLVCILGDALGFMISSWGYMYMPWVGLTSGVTSLIAGFIFYFLKFNFKGSLYVKIVIICLLSLFVGTIFINSTGFYFYNYKMFSPAFLDYATSKYGGNSTYFAYVFYRLFFKGQIFNCLFNYALAILIIPLFTKTSFYKNAI